MNSPEAPPPELAPGLGTTEAAPTIAESASLRDAQLVAARVSADEEAADVERARLSSEPLTGLAHGIEPNLALGPDELVHAVRHAAILEPRGAAEQEGGTLYLTSHRLVHIGTQVREVDLEAITEIAVSLERLLLVGLTDGSDLAIEVDQPRLLRVQLAAARAAARERAA
ncbi:MAG: hypothetical protein ABJC24_08650 [Chloroflexota bacterium]